MNNDALNESFSSYSEGTPIVNKIDNIDFFSQINLNGAPMPKIERKQSKLDNDNPPIQSSKTIKLEKKPTMTFTNEETLILPNSKKPIRIFTIYDKDKKTNNTETTGVDPLLQKEINELKLSKFERKHNFQNGNEFNHQSVPHPSLVHEKKRVRSADIVDYKSLLQVLDEQHREEKEQNQIPTMMIAQGIAPAVTVPGDNRRKSQINFLTRKPKKENPLAAKFLIMRQQRKKRKEPKKMRRKSCTCNDCGGPVTSYQLKYNDIEALTAMAKKVRLANIVIGNLRNISQESKSYRQKKEQQMNMLKAALEKTIFEEEVQNEQKQADQPLLLLPLQLDQERQDKSTLRLRTTFRQTYINDLSPDKNTPLGSKLTDQDYRERLTQTDLDNYKFNRNKSNYSRPQENIKKMRNTMITYNIIESLTNIHDDNSSFNIKSSRQNKQNLTMSLKNLMIPERQSPEKRPRPYKLQERSAQNPQFKQLPPKVVLRKDLQNLFFKKSEVIDRILDGIDEPPKIQKHNNQSQQIHTQSKNITSNYSIDLAGNTQQFFQSVLQQRQSKANSHANIDLLSLKVPQSSKYSNNTVMTTPLKQKSTPAIYPDRNSLLLHNKTSSQNGLEQHNLFFSKDLTTTKSQLLNPYTNRGKMTPLRNRSQHILPQIDLMSVSTRK